jgi:uncharacterized protein (TIGR01244 family)
VVKLIRSFSQVSKWKLFFVALILTISVKLTNYYMARPKFPVTAPELKQLSENVFLTSQLQPATVPYLKRNGIRTVIAVRPDGEAPDQPSSTEIAAAAEEQRYQFHYIPVPHDSIPEEAIDSLHDALTLDQGPFVLYCRTGRRAVRLFALTEAMRADGPNADAILEMVTNAGFTADDLREDIAKRISRRSPQTKKANP